MVIKIMDDIVDSIQCIGIIILLINDIVFQINILVLNVVVEVVCVGEQGKGFVVVVGEVCYLVSCSVNVVNDICKLIDVSVDKV